MVRVVCARPVGGYGGPQGERGMDYRMLCVCTPVSEGWISRPINRWCISIHVRGRRTKGQRANSCVSGVILVGSV